MVLLPVALLAACGSSLTSGSSCADFLHASPTERDSAVKDVGLKMHINGAGSPLVLPNVEYLCGNTPSMTLGQAVARSGS